MGEELQTRPGKMGSVGFCSYLLMFPWFFGACKFKDVESLTTLSGSSDTHGQWIARQIICSILDHFLHDNLRARMHIYHANNLIHYINYIYIVYYMPFFLSDLPVRSASVPS